LRDAELLLEVERTTGAVYLAGYAVECALKALLLDATPKRKRKETLDSFRAAKAHNFKWLKKRYLSAGGPPLPEAAADRLLVVDFWNTTMR